MRIVFISIVLSVFVVGATANDGAFYANGATLVPMHNTSIRMSREDLQLKRQGKTCLVTVQYLFVNDGNDTTIDVGFVTGPPGGDVPEEMNDNPQIKAFKVVANGKPLTGKWKRVSETGRGLFEPDSARQMFDGYFVYLFKMKFPHGVSKVQHSYKYVIGSFVDWAGSVHYTLSSGTLWKGNAIDTFNLTINMGDSVLVSVPQGFSTRAMNVPWKSKGDAMVVDTIRWDLSEDTSKRFLLYSIGKGSLSLSRTSFTPSEELMVILYDGRKVLERIDKDGDVVIAKLTSTEVSLARKEIRSQLQWAEGDDKEALNAILKKLH